MSANVLEQAAYLFAEQRIVARKGFAHVSVSKGSVDEFNTLDPGAGLRRSGFLSFELGYFFLVLIRARDDQARHQKHH